MSKETEIADLIRPAVEEQGLFLEDVKLTRAGKHSALRVTIDLPEGPGGVDSEKLAAATRAISAILDDVDPISGAYNLEVSTPGAERKLKEPRHFSRAQGRLVKVVLDGGESVNGRVVGLNGDNVTLALDGAEREIPLAAIVKANVQIEF
ncbi:ribosome maturation factor RimP [Trueperella pecoris]|uniref:Ribosome maturation factor RimP n=1 Tax=Trueperella pecoris TaxID=2733571 RepID=A0A7M1R2K1_9ACTO|nr:ribosome maturation factor RimP [Trueperella pecoris]QOR48383.1 ribosome maturation factor RimP [Trueperella pecoris]